MNRKTILSILAVLTALCLLTGCGGAQEIPAADTETSAAPAEASAVQETVPEASAVQATTPEASAAQATAPEVAPVGENQFIFTRANFPRLDGSAFTVPLGQAVASVLLGESRAQASEVIRFSKTSRAYRALMEGEADVVLASEPSPAIWADKDEGGYDWDMAPFAVDALVFIVNAKNPLENLSRTQLRDIYTGAVTNWSEAGGENLDIIAFQRDEEAGSQTAMENLVMEGGLMADAPTELVRGELGDLVEAVAAFEDSPAAIGYMMYYAAHNMGMADGLKILSVDGAAPSAETIRSGAYPFLTNYYAVTDAGRRADDPAKLLYDWILSADGQRLVAHEGYTPITEAGGERP